MSSEATTPARFEIGRYYADHRVDAAGPALTIWRVDERHGDRVQMTEFGGCVEEEFTLRMDHGCERATAREFSASGYDMSAANVVDMASMLEALRDMVEVLRPHIPDDGISEIWAAFANLADHVEDLICFEEFLREPEGEREPLLDTNFILPPPREVPA